MTCNDCVHGCVCEYTPSDIDGKEILDLCKKGKQSEIPDMENRCCDFKDKSRFIELPCKVGDTVYVPWEYAYTRGIASVQVEEIKIYDSKNHFMLLIDMQSDNEVFNQSFGGWKTDKSIGDTVFLSREEAEKKLEEMKK